MTVPTQKIYAAITAVRIQTWLTRAPKLRMLRGGSHLLDSATDTTPQGPIIRLVKDEYPGIAVEHTLGPASGVVVLSGDDPTTVAQAQAGVITHLRAAIPGLQWAHWIATGDNFQHAREVAPESAPTSPEQIDFPGAGYCNGCHSEFARAARNTDPNASRDAVAEDGADGQPDDVTTYGADCTARHEVNKRKERVPDEPRNFKELATNSRTPKRLSNQLATIVGDGNNIGGLFRRLRHQPPELVVAVSAALAAATQDALDAAESAVSSGEKRRAICHYAGGDDVFVSTCAGEGWSWLRAFDSAFRYAVSYAAAHFEGEIADAITGLTFSFGMVIADSGYPIADSHRLAEIALSNAKRVGGGVLPAVGWADLKVESIPDKDRVFTFDQLSELSRGERAAMVFSIDNSARTTLDRLLKKTRDDAVVKAWARRVGNYELARFVDHTPDWHEELRNTIVLQRWWTVKRVGAGAHA